MPPWKATKATGGVVVARTLYTYPQGEHCSPCQPSQASMEAPQESPAAAVGHQPPLVRAAAVIAALRARLPHATRSKEDPSLRELRCVSLPTREAPDAHYKPRSFACYMDLLGYARQILPPAEVYTRKPSFQR